MTSDSAYLLKRLEPAVRPPFASRVTAPPAAPLEGQSFDELLTLAAKGSLSSGRQVQSGFDPARELSPSELARLSKAADLAEASGARRALLLMEGRGLVLDVASRLLTAELSDDPSAPIANVDAAIYVPDPENADGDEALKPPGSGLVHPAVAKHLDAARGRPGGPAPAP